MRYQSKADKSNYSPTVSVDTVVQSQKESTVSYNSRQFFEMYMTFNNILLSNVFSSEPAGVSGAPYVFFNDALHTIGRFNARV